MGLGASLREKPRRGRDERGVEVAAQRARAEIGGEALLGEPRDRRRRHVEDHAGLREPATLGEPADRDLGDPRDLVGRQRMEHDDLIEAVDELGPEHGVNGGAIAAFFDVVLVRGPKAQAGPSRCACPGSTSAR